MSRIEIRSQAGPQRAFLKTKADVAFYGGAAGGGKTFALLLEPLFQANNPNFGCTIFRKNMTQVKNMGGLWDESMKLYPLVNATPREFRNEWTMASGMEVKFAHLERDSDVYNWQGAQIPLIEFDELTHFSEFQFIYMLSRNRSMSGVPGRIRATMNPDADSWVRKFIDWWIDKDGYAIPERSGVIRYFIRLNDEWIWADSAEEIYNRYGRGPEIMPKSFTFIPSKLQDNKILMEKDPSYLANLLMQNKVERERLLEGNWNIRPSAGNYFKEEWFPIVDAVPHGWIDCIRFWDRAATKPTPLKPDPDWTRGLKMYKYPDGRCLVADLKSDQDTPGKIRTLIQTVASHDGDETRIFAQQDPGSAGVLEAEDFVRSLSGFNVGTRTYSKDKITRAKPVSAQAEHGNVMVLRAPWNDTFFKELENFPDGNHDDIVDALSGAFNETNEGNSLFDAT